MIKGAGRGWVASSFPSLQYSTLIDHCLEGGTSALAKANHGIAFFYTVTGYILRGLVQIDQPCGEDDFVLISWCWHWRNVSHSIRHSSRFGEFWSVWSYGQIRCRLAIILVGGFDLCYRASLFTNWASLFARKTFNNNASRDPFSCVFFTGGMRYQQLWHKGCEGVLSLLEDSWGCHEDSAAHLRVLWAS